MLLIANPLTGTFGSTARYIVLAWPVFVLGARWLHGDRALLAAATLLALGLLVVVPLAVLLACGLLIRRHMSLPTRDGRVPIVGLDRELSWDALNRYQALQGGRGERLEALPVGRHQGYGDELLEPKEAPAPESESKP